MYAYHNRKNVAHVSFDITKTLLMRLDLHVQGCLQEKPVNQKRHIPITNRSELIRTTIMEYLERHNLPVN